MKSILEGIGIGVVAIIVIGLALLITPIFSVLIGWLAGFVLQLVFGSLIADGLNALFGTTRFNPEQLPMICATLAVIGSFFRTVQTTNNSRGGR